MKKARRIYNLTMSKKSAYDVDGGIMEFSPDKSLLKPQKPQPGIYYIVENPESFIGRHDILWISCIGRSIAGAKIYQFKDTNGEEVMFDSVMSALHP